MLRLEQIREALAPRYDVRRELARGPVSVVLLARDVSLDRPVAIKVLAQKAGPEAAERFLREARLLAKLRHPNIVRIHEADQVDGLTYYVMQYLESPTLAERLKQRRLTQAEARRLGADLLAALEAAHRHYILHRDVHPDSIFLLEDRAVLADFGIATRTDASRTATSGEHGREGTAGYMAPESFLREECTPLSDLYAVGTVLYEALSGRRWDVLNVADRADWTGIPIELLPVLERALAWSPAKRWPDARSFRQALEVDPERAAGAPARPPRSLLASFKRRRLPQIAAAYIAGAWLALELVDQLVERAFLPEVVYPLCLIAVSVGFAGALFFGWLHGEPGRQVVRPVELWGLVVLLLIGLAAGAVTVSRRAPVDVDLAAGRYYPGSPDPARVAVLYFDPLTAGSELNHLADGLTEELIGDLSRTAGLEVISKNGVRPYRGSPVPLDSLVRMLGIGSVVEGSVLRSGDRVRVMVRLVDAAANANLASRTLERPFGELFQLQDDLTREVSIFLRQRLGREVEARTERGGTTSVAAWQLVLRAQLQLDRARSLALSDGLADAVRAAALADSLLALAESLDPAWTRPIVSRGRVAALEAWMKSGGGPAWDPESLARGVAHAERALALDPADPEALELRGTLRFRLFAAACTSDAEGLLAGAEADLMAALSADPGLASAWNTLSELKRTGRADLGGARAAARRAYEADRFLNKASEVLQRLVLLSIELGDHEEAARWLREGRRWHPEHPGLIATELSFLASEAGPTPDVARAWGLLDSLLRLSPARDGRWLLPIAEMRSAGVLYRAGHADSARAVFQRARAQVRDDELAATVAFDEARIWLLMGRRDQALDRLAVHLRSNPRDRARLATDHQFSALWHDRRFRELVGETHYC